MSGDVQLWAFWIQGIIYAIVFPMSFFAYRWVRAPRRDRFVQFKMAELGVTDNEEVLKAISNHHYRNRDYAWPVFATSCMVFILYSMTHPAVIATGIWGGVLERVINIFQVPALLPDIAAGRFLYWGFVGAWVYSLNLVLRRFMAYDLTPSVYVFVINRFLLAWVIGAATGMTLGTYSRQAGVHPDVNMVSVFIVAFFIGFFPERGMSWIAVMSKRALGQDGGIAKETRLSSIEGLSIWHQGRLQQEGIENVQNLSAASVPILAISTPFTVGQIIDWVDQAILLVYANDAAYAKLENVGVRCASDFIVIAGDDEYRRHLAQASTLTEYHLEMLYQSVLSAANIDYTAKYRGVISLDAGRKALADQIQPMDTATIRAVRDALVSEADPMPQLEPASQTG